MAAKAMIYFIGGSAILSYVAIAAFRPEEKKIKELGGLEKSASRSGGISSADIIRLASDTDKPIYRLNKKELDALIQTSKEK